jgi:PAS domain S-box-containing protein
MPPQQSRFRSILTFAILLVVLVTAVSVALYENRLRQDVNAEINRELAQLSGHGRSILLGDLSQYRDNLYFLHATPPISGMARARANSGVDPFDGTEFSQWKQRLETIFVSMLQNNPEIDQLRVIEVDETGREIVRVDRLSGKIDVISRQWLQDKADTSYFEKSVELSRTELFISRINLNREYGKVEYPIRPTIRLSTPIFNENLTRFGFLIMNVNAASLINDLRKETTGQFNTILTDDEGYYIDHPNDDYRFSRDLAPDRNWNTDYSTTTADSKTDALATERATGQQFAFHHQTIQFSSDPASVMHLYAIAPPGWINQQLMNQRLPAYGFGGAALLILFVTLGLFLRSYRSSVRLAATRAEFEAIISGSSSAIIGMELNGRITSCNDTALSLLRAPRDLVIGKQIFDFPVFADIDLREQIESVQNTNLSQVLNGSGKSPSGEEQHFAVTLSPISIESRNVVGVALIARDVTVEKAAEREIRQVNAKLESEVAKRTEELAEAHKKALHASGMKSSFISHVSHEMRTPLNGLSGSLNLIKREPLSDSQRKYLEMAETSSFTLATLINDILDLSKIEAGKLDFDENPFDPLATLEFVAQSFAMAARERNIDLILDTTELQHDRLVGDANRLKQVLNNLISNAIKFTSKGYVAISAASRVEDDQVRLDIRVEDSGIGIADENKYKLFEAFSQEDKTVAANFGGTGLGLLICKQLCVRMNGKIDFESEKGVGSAFFFHLCFDAKTASKRSQSQILAGKNVTLAMNQAKTREFSSRIIQFLGGNVTDTPISDPRNEVLITDQRGADLQAIIDEIKATTKSPDKLPTLCMVKNHDGESPDYEGPVVTVTSPLTESGLIAGFSVVVEQTSNPTIGSAKPQNDTDIDTGSGFEDINILLVDDNDINLAVAKGFLGVTKANIQTARNGIEAIETLRQNANDGNDIHVVLMDCQMPGMDGYETTNLIRSGKVVERLSEVPIIAMTASAMSGEREKCIAAGMSDYITKPIQADILLDRVQHWSQERRAHLEAS